MAIWNLHERPRQSWLRHDPAVAVALADSARLGSCLGRQKAEVSLGIQLSSIQLSFHHRHNIGFVGDFYGDSGKAALGLFSAHLWSVA